MKILRHRLQHDDGAPVPFENSPNQRGGLDAKYLIIHYTAGSSADSSVRWLTNPASEASAHLVIGRDGSITQLVAFDRVAWHAGKSRWHGLASLNKQERILATYIAKTRAQAVAAVQKRLAHEQELAKSEQR